MTSISLKIQQGHEQVQREGPAGPFRAATVSPEKLHQCLTPVAGQTKDKTRLDKWLLQRKQPLNQKLKLDFAIANKWLSGIAIACIAIHALVRLMLSITPGPENAYSVACEMTFVFAGCALLITGIVWVILHFYKAHYASHLREIENGNYLAHWSYSAEEWASFVVDNRKAGRDMALYCAGALVFTSSLVIIMAIFGNVSWWNIFLLSIGSILITIILVTFVLLLRRFHNKRLAANGPMSTFIGPRGLYAFGGYRSYKDMASPLLRVEFKSTDRLNYLVFVFQAPSNDYAAGELEFEVPIPERRLIEATMIAKLLRRHGKCCG